MCRIKAHALLVAAVVLSACSSSPQASGVLEPLEQAQPNPVAATSEPVISPSLQKLTDRLSALGYEPVGMAYESDATLDLLFKVFSDPLVQNRRIRLVYTGLQLAYDARAESLTIGGTSDAMKILAFIKKSVPVKPTTP